MKDLKKHGVLSRNLRGSTKCHFRLTSGLVVRSCNKEHFCPFLYTHFTNFLIRYPNCVMFMKKSLCIVAIFLLSLATPILGSAQSEPTDGIEVLHTAVNPANNNTYHLLSASSWEDAASFARSLDGFLVTVDNEAENSWLFDTFSSWDNQSRHL